MSNILHLPMHECYCIDYSVLIRVEYDVMGMWNNAFVVAILFYYSVLFK